MVGRSEASRTSARGILPDLPAERAGETRARLVDACVRCLRALIPRVDADAQRQGLDALAGALEAALNPAKLAMMASDDEKRKHATAQIARFPPGLQMLLLSSDVRGTALGKATTV